MKDFEERFASLLSQGLTWRWKDIRVTGERITEGKIDKCFIKVYYPDEYKKQYPAWDREYAHPINQAVGHILFALGFGCMMGDATPDSQGFFELWLVRNKEAYDRLPSLIHALLPSDIMQTDLQ